MTKRTLGQLRTQIHTGLLMSNDPELGGRRALVNFAYLAAVMTTDEVIDAMKRGASGRDIARPPRQYNLNL